MSDQLVFDEDYSRRIEEIYGTPDVVEQRRPIQGCQRRASTQPVDEQGR